MKNTKFVEVPASKEQDVNEGLTTWKDGKYVSIDEGTHVTYFIAHESSARVSVNPEGEEVTIPIVTAFPIRVAKPISRANIINAAEMQYYELNNALDVASFGASLARKARENANDEEVIEHDLFIQEVKNELNRLLAERTIHQAAEEMREKIRQYNNSTAVNQMSYNGMKIWFTPLQRTNLSLSISAAERDNRETVKLPLNEIVIELPITTARVLLDKMVLYASDSSVVTANHLANVDKIEESGTIEEIDQYDYTTGYINDREI